MKFPISHQIGRLRFVGLAFYVGFATMTLELVATRIIAPYLGNTLFTWTSVIGVILGALAFGYWAGGQIADARNKSTDISYALLISSGLLMITQYIKDPLLHSLMQASGDVRITTLLATLILFAPATTVMATVPPYLAKLALKNLETSGATVAKLSMSGTIGSIMGTFFTGYIAFTWLSTRQLLVWIAISLVVAAIACRKKLTPLAAGVLAIMFLLVNLSPALAQMDGVIVDIDTPYNRVIIRDTQLGTHPARVLQFEGRSLQSGKYLDGTTTQPFTYTRAFKIADYLRNDVKKSLLIGGGAYTFAQDFADSHAESHMDVVEIDPDLIKLARNYFEYTDPANVTNIIADGRRFINQTKNQYDTIYVDAYGSYSPPFQLMTSEAAGDLHRLTGSEGLVVANLISALNGNASEHLRATAAAYREHFRYVEVFSCNPNVPGYVQQNLIMLASDQPFELNPEITDTELSAMFATLSPVDSGNTAAYRDELAPVEFNTLPAQ